MRIDAVFLVAPEPEPPSMPTRRAFLMTAGALVIGAGGGGACGYSMGKVAGKVPEKAPEATPANEPQKSSGDAELDRWRRVAVTAPLDELFDKGVMFLLVRVRDYPRDAVLWRGVERMVIEIRDNPSRQVDERVLVTLPAQLEGPARPDSPSLREFIPVLRQRRQQLRRK